MKGSEVRRRCCPFCGEREKLEVMDGEVECLVCGCRVREEYWGRRYVDKVAYFYTEAGEIGKVDYVGRE